MESRKRSAPNNLSSNCHRYKIRRIDYEFGGVSLEGWESVLTDDYYRINSDGEFVVDFYKICEEKDNIKNYIKQLRYNYSYLGRYIEDISRVIESLG